MFELLASFIIAQNQPSTPPVNCGQGLVWNAQKGICEPKKQPTQPQPETRKPQPNPTPAPSSAQEFCKRYPQDYACNRGGINK